MELLTITPETATEVCHIFADYLEHLVTTVDAADWNGAADLVYVQQQVQKFRKEIAEGTFKTFDTSTCVWFRDVAIYFFGPDYSNTVARMLAAWGPAFMGGNMWSAWDCYVASSHPTLGLTAPGEDYRIWEESVKHGGFRYVHREFAVISDFPDRMCINEECQSHHELIMPDGTVVVGPSHEWPGLKAWHIGQIQVDEQIVMAPETQTLQQMENESDADRRSIRFERFGWARYVKEANLKPIDERTCDISGTKEQLYVTKDGQKIFLAVCSTGKLAQMPVHPDLKTCEETQKWLRPPGFENMNMVFAT